MDASPQVSLHRQTCVDAPGRLKSTSQAEYAGSIPVIGSAKYQLGKAIRNLSYPPRALLDRRLTGSRRIRPAETVCCGKMRHDD
jgi:hypothetical protein